MNRIVKLALILVAVLIFGFLLIQLIPVQRTNPPVVTQIKWDSPQTQALWQRACADCHSNETIWPWYSYVAPASWLVSFDVVRGRRELNISELNTSSSRFASFGNRLVRAVQEGEMPPVQYLIMHPNAHLTAQESQQLINGLQATFANQP